MIGFWFAENPKAVGYYGPNTVKVSLEIENPLLIDTETYYEYRVGPSEWAKKAYVEGYDSAVIQDIVDGDTESTVACVFDPSRIKILKFDVYGDDQ